MNLKFRIPTEHQFAFVEIDVEIPEEGPLMTAPQVRAAYDEYIAAFKVQEGLSTKEFNDCLDAYRTTKTMNVECHERMNEEQKWLFHEIDKSNTRLAYKAKK